MSQLSTKMKLKLKLCLAILKNTFQCGGWLEKLGLKLTSAKVEVEVEGELGKNQFQLENTAPLSDEISPTIYKN